MNNLKFISYSLVSFILLISYGFAGSLDVTVTTYDFPTEAAPYPLLVFPISPGGWGVSLQPNKKNETIAAVSRNLKFNGSKVRYDQGKKESPCMIPQNFDPTIGVKFDVEYNHYQKAFMCYVSNKP